MYNKYYGYSKILDLGNIDRRAGGEGGGCLPSFGSFQAKRSKFGQFHSLREWGCDGRVRIPSPLPHKPWKPAHCGKTETDEKELEKKQRKAAAKPCQFDGELCL